MSVKPFTFVLSALILSSSITAVAGAEESFQIAQLRRDKEEEVLPPARPLPKFYARHVAEGNKLLAQNRLTEAMDEFFTAETINPDYYPTYIGKGQVYIKQGRFSDAAKEYQRAVKLLNPSYASDHVKDGDYYYNMGRFELSIESYWEALRIDPQAGAQYTLGMRHLRFANEKAAIKAFEEAAKMDEDYPDPHFQLGNIYFRQKKYNKAVPEYDKAVEMAPRNRVYHFFAANALYNQGASKKKVNITDIKKALVHFERAQQLGLSTANMHFNMGTSYLLDGQNDLAISHLRTALSKRVEQKQELDEEIFYNLGNAYYRRAMQIKFEWDGRTNMAHNKMEKEQNDTKFDYLTKAIVSYHRALTIKNDYGPVFYDLGAAYYRISELKPIADMVDKFVLLKPEVEKDYVTKGMKFFKGDMLARSLANFQAYTSYGSDAKMKRNAYKIIADLEPRAKAAAK